MAPHSESLSLHFISPKTNRGESFFLQKCWRRQGASLTLTLTLTGSCSVQGSAWRACVPQSCVWSAVMMLYYVDGSCFPTPARACFPWSCKEFISVFFTSWMGGELAGVSCSLGRETWTWYLAFVPSPRDSPADDFRSPVLRPFDHEYWNLALACH